MELKCEKEGRKQCQKTKKDEKANTKMKTVGTRTGTNARPPLDASVHTLAWLITSPRRPVSCLSDSSP